MSEIEEKDKDNRKELSKKMLESEKKWKIVIDDLSERVRGDLKGLIDAQTEAISQRQNVSDEVKSYSLKMYKYVQKVKILEKARFEFYATSYQVKTNGTERLRLINADLSEHQLFIDELDLHINHLRETAKNLDNIHYSVKNRIELSNIFDGYK